MDDHGGYRIDGAATAVDLVNAVTSRAGDASDAALAELLVRHHYLVTGLTGQDGDRLRVWARELRGVFTACADGQDAVELLNGLMARVPLRPHISDHGLGPHLHYGVPGADLVDRVRANTVVGLAFAVCEHGPERLGRCQASGCDRVLVDVLRGRRRRYCSKACQNRSSVAAFRARTATAGPGGG
jgi:CGNR zinc finger/Putative stress-induced transcription regulator